MQQHERHERRVPQQDGPHRDLRRAFPMFVIGLALAEGCGLLGIFLGGPYRDDVFLLGVLGLVQFTPWFAHRLLDPAPAGYIPNN